MKTKRIIKQLFCTAVLAILLINGCRSADPDFERSVAISVPDNFSYAGGPAGGDRMWWKTFESNELNSLIADALENNFDVKAVKARLDQARASLEKERASFLPELDYSAGGQKKETKVKTSRDSASISDGSHSWDVGLTGVWSPDIWGEFNASQQSQQQTVEAVKQDIEFTRWELAARIAEIWIDIIATRNKIDILEKQIVGSDRQLDLLELRFANGAANALDVSQQREALAETRSQRPLLERQEKILYNALVFLSGKSSPGTISIQTARLPETVMMPSAGIPADLLVNRPDIKAARQRLVSSLWEVKVAEADLLPSLTLTARALFSSGDLDLLFSNWVASLTAAVTGPIFDGGFKKAEVDRVKAVADELLHNYAQTVAGAIRDVEDSLVTIFTQDDYIRLLEEELDLARLTLQDALLQYWNGKSSYLNYLIVLTRIERLERQLIGEKAGAIKERVALYRVLGFAPIPSSERHLKHDS